MSLPDPPPHQFVRHMCDKVQLQIKATSRSYTRQLEGRLGMLLQGLQGSLGGALERETNRIRELTDEQGRLVQLQDRARKLRCGCTLGWCVYMRWLSGVCEATWWIC